MSKPYILRIIWFLTICFTIVSGTLSVNSQTNVENIYTLLSRPTYIESANGFTIKEIVNDYALRHMAPSVDFQSINFPSGSAVIPITERWKVEPLAEVIHQFVRTNPKERFIIEGHTDTVGNFEENLHLSLARADAVSTLLTHDHLVPTFAITPVGFGYTDLAVNTKGPNPRNRRVTLRRITDLVFPIQSNQTDSPVEESVSPSQPKVKPGESGQAEQRNKSILDL